ncbi:MAG: small basic protein [Planctomycetota bacterium]|jgi:small basic protein (TIGR04137 family)|nr:small basic protein [Planctomycetota bacterium]
MSIHSSLKYSSALSRVRNVFKRVERLQILRDNERWDEEQSVFGLPKVRTRFKVFGAKKKKVEADEENEQSEGEGEAASP